MFGETFLDLGPIIRRREFPVPGIRLEGRPGRRQRRPAQNGELFLSLGKHRHAIAALRGSVELAAGVHGDDRALAFGAVLAPSIRKVGHVVPFQRADDLEVAGGDHGIDENPGNLHQGVTQGWSRRVSISTLSSNRPATLCFKSRRSPQSARSSFFN